MRFHFFPLSPNCRKTLLVLNHLNMDIELCLVDIRKEEHKQEAFLKLNPNGKVPVLETEEGTLWESNAICCFLASQVDSPLWPKNMQRYEIMRWQHWESCHWTPTIGLFIGENLVKKTFKGEQPDAIALNSAEVNFHHYAKVLDDHLADRAFILGELTLADFSVAPIFAYKDLASLPYQEYRNIERWFNDMTKLPSWQKMEEDAEDAA